MKRSVLSGRKSIKSGDSMFVFLYFPKPILRVDYDAFFDNIFSAYGKERKELTNVGECPKPENQRGEEKR